jgi:hypothetical protein
MFLKIEEFRVYESLKTAREIYKDKIGIDVVNKLAELDPSKTKKYVEKMCAFYRELPEFDTIGNMIKSYDELCNKRIIKRNDITSFKDITEFGNELALHDGIMSKRAKRQAIKDNDVAVILDNADYYIISPKTHEAAMLYGAGTKWCITEKDPTYWKRYTENENAVFYFVISKKIDVFDDRYKIAVGVAGNSRMFGYDAADNQLSDDECTKFTKPFKELLRHKPISEDDFFAKNKMKYKLGSDGKYIITECLVSELKCYPDNEIQISEYHDDIYTLVNSATGTFPLLIDELHGSLIIHDCNLRSCKGFPKKINGYKISITSTDIANLTGITKDFDKFLMVRSNKLTSLKGSPEKLKGFDCSRNKQLKTLIGGPKQIVSSSDNINENNYSCINCGLTSLKGVAEHIDGDFFCLDNDIANLDYFPKTVTGRIVFGTTNKDIKEDDIRKVCKVGGSIMIKYR